jgi:hypothetical protein
MDTLQTFNFSPTLTNLSPTGTVPLTPSDQDSSNLGASASLSGFSLPVSVVGSQNFKNNAYQMSSSRPPRGSSFGSFDNTNNTIPKNILVAPPSSSATKFPPSSTNNISLEQPKAVPYCPQPVPLYPKQPNTFVDSGTNLQQQQQQQSQQKLYSQQQQQQIQMEIRRQQEQIQHLQARLQSQMQQLQMHNSHGGPNSLTRQQAIGGGDIFHMNHQYSNNQSLMHSQQPPLLQQNVQQQHYPRQHNNQYQYQQQQQQTGRRPRSFSVGNNPMIKPLASTAPSFFQPNISNSVSSMNAGMPQSKKRTVSSASVTSMNNMPRNGNLTAVASDGRPTTITTPSKLGNNKVSGGWASIVASNRPKHPKKGGNRGKTQSIHKKQQNKELFSIDLTTLRNGEEKRTTLMIQNIPNKYTRQMLVDELNENNLKCYDFLYLPIDFRNKCNLGYAFINMISKENVIHIYETFRGESWKRSRSEKKADIKWGRLQGKTALIDHFRASSFLKRIPNDCRPITYFSDGENKGEIECYIGGIEDA